MSTFEATTSAAQADAVAPAEKAARFGGESQAFLRLLARGAVLLMFTLGLYRFWLTTDVRRFLWSNTELAGDSFEYAGTARELLLGFVIAVAILLPLYTGFFLATLSLGALTALSNVAALLGLTLLGQYAVYRARRYRLTRTVYRGVRFHQTGSAWRFAVCAMFWWMLTALTLGLAYPFAQARLERFKMANTFFGNLPGHFTGSGLRLFLRGIALWLVGLGPFFAAVIATILGLDWAAIAAGSGGDDLLNRLEASGIERAAIYAGLGGIWLLIAIALLYPCFQAMVLRWWASGLRFGSICVSSRLRTGQVLGLYARFLGYALLFTLLAVAIVALGAFAIDKAIGEFDSIFKEIVATGAIVVAYVGCALGYSTIYRATVRLGLWRCLVESLEVSNLAVLETVSAAGEAASPVGEGLADALSVGGA